jgi:hypothetical protein
MPFTKSLGAQRTVNATKDDSRVIAAIRSRVGVAEQKLPTYAVVDHDLVEYATEGSTVRGYFDGSRLMKLKARHFWETGRATEEYYFDGGEPMFVYRIDERYDRPLSGHVVSRVETRYYISRRRLVRRVHTPAGSADGEFGEWMSAEEVRQEAKQLTQCARATTPGPCKLRLPSGMVVPGA